MRKFGFIFDPILKSVCGECLMLCLSRGKRLGEVGEVVVAIGIDWGYYRRGRNEEIVVVLNEINFY